ncbi:MAG TPA: DUF4159 domain-containing protein [Opitutaceae bacterium]|nr:DUF4159 domain-containing protein [Opitutaceae bacterium]
MTAGRKFFLVGALGAIAAGALSAQPMRGRRGLPPPDWPGNANESSGSGHYVWIEQGGMVDEDTVRTARETASHSSGTPEWTNPPGFEKDVFTFARVIFPTARAPGDRWNYGGRLGWWVDYPDADLNFSYRLQTLTSTRVDPDARVLKLTDPSLTDYPLIYMEHIESMRLPDQQVDILRRYLLNGGALLINDIWNIHAWQNLEAEMKRVLPERGWVELAPEHPMFHCVFDLRGTMKDWQVPTLQFWNRDYDPRDPNSTLQWRDRGPGSEDMHVRAWLDDKGRPSVLVIYNSDVSDGWEREGENSDYFHRFSEKISYPLGINLVFYLMTH